MSTITAQVTTAITTIPLLRHRDTVVNFPADQDDFVAKYEATNDHLSVSTVPQINAVGNEIDIVTGQINIVAGEVSANAVLAETAASIAAGHANYKGDWVAGYATTGYSLNMSVSFTDGYNYVSKINNNLVSPTTLTNTAEWNFIEAVNPNDVLMKSGGTMTGAIIYNGSPLITRAKAHAIALCF